MYILFEIFLLFFTIFYLIFFDTNNSIIHKICIIVTFFVFIVSLFQYSVFDISEPLFQDFIVIPFLNFGVFNFIIGVDGLSICLIVLTTFLIFLCFVISYNTISINIKYFCVHLLILEALLILTFSSLNVFFFYIFFESTLIPMYFIIGSWGSKTKKTRAAFLFFIYTLVGSLLMLFGIILIYIEVGSLNYTDLILIDIMHICNINNDLTFFDSTIVYIQSIVSFLIPFLGLDDFLWFLFLIAFAVKTPIIPFHIWLPEAHVEAPTVGSIILAGILLKLGIFGFLKFLFMFFPFCNYWNRNYINVLGIISIVYSSMLALRQNDIKKLIAYASIAHMNMIVLGLYSFNIIGIEGSILQMVSHCFTSSGLFLCAGNLYDRYHTRLIQYYGGFDRLMPVFTTIFFIYILANMSFPGTANFIGEFLILKGIFSISKFISILAATSLFLSCAYSLIFFVKITKGPISGFILKSFDLNSNEILIHCSLIFFIFLFGFFPNIIIDLVRESSIHILNVGCIKLDFI